MNKKFFEGHDFLKDIIFAIESGAEKLVISTSTHGYKENKQIEERTLIISDDIKKFFNNECVSKVNNHYAVIEAYKSIKRKCSETMSFCSAMNLAHSYRHSTKKFSIKIHSELSPIFDSSINDDNFTLSLEDWNRAVSLGKLDLSGTDWVVSWFEK